MPPITHIVIFQYKSDTTTAQKNDIACAFLALRTACLSPNDNPNFTSAGSPYILDIIAGSNNSSEEPARGYEHAYIVTFSSGPQRDYYVNQDPAHDAFKKKVGPLLEKVVVTDFTDGVWT
jgi:hypothetical protein